MSWVRVSRFAVSVTLGAGALIAASSWLASTGCGNQNSSGNGFSGPGDSGSPDSTLPGFVPPFVTGSSSEGATNSGGSGGSMSGVSSGGSVGGSTANSSGGGSTGAPACTTNTGPISGTVGITGGSVSRLVFAAVGDTRPASEDDPNGYPTSIITKIFQDIEGLSPRPVLTLGTGDYQFTSATNDSDANAQIQIFMQARQSYSGPWFPAMGNHECGVSGSYTTSDNNDCGPGNPGGATANYNAFISGMMSTLNKTLPYYSFNVNATDNSWTAKFVITAANAWSDAQQSWLTSTMAQKTTYTFVVRHEASDAMPPIPDCIPTIDSIITAAGYTILIVGHTHDYGHYSDAPQTVVFGNGGAPLSSTNYDYGYGLFSQRCDGAIVVDAYDYQSGLISTYDFPVVFTPEGQITH